VFQAGIRLEYISMETELYAMGANQSDIHTHYKTHEVIGRGNFGIVKRCTKKSTKEEFAVKEIPQSKIKDAVDRENVMQEVEIMKQLEHPNFVKMYDLYESKKKVYMVLELVTGGEMFDRIVSKGTYSEKEAAATVKTMAIALQYMHGQNIVHRDLKPENLLYSSPSEDAVLKIVDFGLAKAGVTPDGQLNSACGTPGYVAPEVLSKSAYGRPVDIWGLGVILYILLCGFPPFYHNDTPELYKLIKKAKYEFPAKYWGDISEEAKDLVRRMLTLKPADRITPAGILQHPWITSGDTMSRKELGNVRRLKLLQARAKLRKGVQAIIALNRFMGYLDQQKT
jgi:serine/threonine protein kinase